MAVPLRILIDFATGDNWEMPIELYEKYQSDLALLQQKDKRFFNGLTLIEFWIGTLNKQEKETVRKK